MKKMTDKKKILFICTHNSCRSQMAEGLVNAMLSEHMMAWSAGTDPSHVNPYAIRVMAELGIDISEHRSKSVEAFTEREFDVVVTVCDRAKESCPFFPAGKQTIHQSFTDPAGVGGTEEEKVDAFRRTRDEILKWLKKNFSV